MTARVLEQEFVETKISELKLHPRNPNQGDIGAITESVEVNGFWGALVVQRSTGHVLVGNHRLVASRELGIDTLPVLYVDVDDEQALRMLAADNRTARLGIDSIDVLSEILIELSMSDSELGLKGTGYDGDDLDAMLADMRELEDTDAEPRQQKPTVVVNCTTAEQSGKLGKDLAQIGHPLQKLTIHCESLHERDALRKALIDLGYAVTTTGSD